MLRLGAVFCVLAVSILGAAHASLVNDNVFRHINLQTNVAQFSTEITLRNTGSAGVDSFDVYFTSEEAKHIADVEVREGDAILGLTRVGEDSKGLKYTVKLASSLGADKTTRVTLLSIATHVLAPHPNTIAQTDNQLVLYFGNVHFYSPYETKSARTDIALGTTSVENFDPTEKATLKGSNLNFGPYNDLPAFSELELLVHYQNNYPFMTITSLVKEVEVSHWGHVSFEEHIDMTHSGAKLKGGFSRLDFQRKSAPSHFRAVVAHLPEDAAGIYYRDVIGNISTSRTRVDRPADSPAFTNLELQPRYLMFGGWKTAFYFGYSSSLKNFLGVQSNGKYELHVPFGTTLEGAVCNNVTTKVILPEGASDISFSGIEDADSYFTTRHTYLDTVGRPVLVVSKTNVVRDNRQDLIVTYRFSSSALYGELLLPVAAFFALFLFFIVAGRVRMTIGEEKVAEKVSKKD